MLKKKHPLARNEKWKFSQPRVGFRAHYVAVDEKSGTKQVLGLSAANTCREGIISDARGAFQTRLTNLTEVSEFRGKNGWDCAGKPPEWVPTGSCDLIDPAGKKKPAELKLQWHPNWMKDWNDQNFKVETFLRVCDVVIGPVAVLLGPWRPRGDKWWRTDPKAAVHKSGDQEYVHWQGSDNWFLAHPATMAIATGLYRQCFHLCGAGIADEVIDTLSEEEVAEVMSTNSQRLALQFVKRTRAWIEVPVADHAYVVNYAFPFGFWRRLIRLQRAIRQHGYEESLGQTFHDGWALTGQSGEWLGAYGFWGTEGELTDHHRHLMKMGAPRRKTSGESASNSA